MQRNSTDQQDSDQPHHKPPGVDDDEARTTRRTLLAGIGSLGLASVGITVGGTNVTRGTEADGSTVGTDPTTTPDELQAFVDEMMESRIGDVTPGASVAIVSGDTPVLTEGYGSADTDADIPAQGGETLFRIGSVGKLVAWTAVMQGVEREVLDLDEDVNAYLADSDVTIPDTYDDPVTLRHLGTHTAGFESALDPDVVTRPDAIAPLEDVLADNQPSRVRPPGELVGYSNYGAALAGHIVAEVHDTTFEDYARSEIFEPLDMAHSTFAQPVPGEHPGTLAAGHTRDGSAFTTADSVFINMRPAGSMSATASDMTAFMWAHLGNGEVGATSVLHPDTLGTMHERHHVRHPAVTNWRYGFHEYGHPDANLIGHSGATINFTSQLVLAPDHEIGICVTYNTNDQDGEGPAQAVDEILANFGLLPAPTRPSSSPDQGWQERSEMISGEYSLTYLPQSGPLQVVDLLEHVTVESVGNGRIVTTSLDGDPREWIETEPYVYQEVGGHDTLAFEVAAGEVTAMNMSSEPFGVYQPVPFHERQLVTGGILGGALSGFGLSLVGWGAVGAKRTWDHRRASGHRNTEGCR